MLDKVETLITNHKSISQENLDLVLELVKLGEQIPENHLRAGVSRSDSICIRFLNNFAVSTATLKNPRQGYKEAVFYDAGLGTLSDQFTKELGYVATHPKHEGMKHCQFMLHEFFPTIQSLNLFATTREPAMIHILSKFGFERVGNVYNKDLNLMIYYGKK